jgi:hypothetical protein
VTKDATQDHAADAKAALVKYRDRCIVEANRLLRDANWAERLLRQAEDKDA